MLRVRIHALRVFMEILKLWQHIFKRHTKIPNPKTIVYNSSEDQLKKEEIFCDPCLHGDLKSKATLFCKTCDVPEPLCADCAVQHTRHKLCRNHELCDNMAEFSIKRVPFKPK